MPRSSRIAIPKTPQYIVQRGHIRQTIFFSDEDYNYYLGNLIYFEQEFNCRIYSYGLITNHVHQVIVPGTNPESLSLLMKRVAGRQTRYVNKREKFSLKLGLHFSNKGPGRPKTVQK